MGKILSRDDRAAAALAARQAALSQRQADFLIRNAAIVAARNAGRSVEELARTYGLTVARIRDIVRGRRDPAALAARDARRARDAAIAAHRRAGYSLSAIASFHGITRQRVQQILGAQAARQPSGPCGGQP